MPQDDRLKAVTRRLVVSFAVGMAMAGTAYLCAWQTMGASSGFRPQHLDAFITFRTLKVALDDYRKQKGSYPEKLADLKKSTHPDAVRVDESGEVRDPWGRPYQYRAQGNNYALFSLGRDGKPGGEGLDEDPNVRDFPAEKEGVFQLPAVGIPTLRQFTFECPTGGVRIACALSGFFAFIACFFTLSTQRKSLTRSVIQLILTLTACLVTAVFMSLLHIPSGH